jgi:diphosphomevalonate decarboxylase
MFQQTIAPISHWPELYAVILVVTESEKKVPSSEAMRNSCATSELMEKRVKDIVPKRVNW